jgi:hypothetical protein
MFKQRKMAKVIRTQNASVFLALSPYVLRLYEMKKPTRATLCVKFDAVCYTKYIYIPRGVLKLAESKSPKH